MRNILCAAALLLGVLLLVLSVVCPVVSIGHNTSIIGGADAPTFAFVFIEYYLWMALAGAGLAVAAIITLLWPKK